ncbi:helix-turn-helix domain-containing protein [Marinomonas spartinae]|uniref:helix-turn-helix domain-containing protein n=1 Tax=Marinomonas spartinae TaxID=1792290 RepID=UPI0018F1180F|nr:AraC family transcriptional regulator [Marinomonas spartinae]MBJ7556781.1 AraC family transcriptional regulator [Marinomonas spartinae]
MKQHISVDGLLEKHKLDFWRQVVCDYFVQVSFDKYQRKEISFHSELIYSKRCDIDLIQVSGTPQLVERTSKKYRDDDYLIFTMLKSGSMEVLQDNRRAILMPGDMVVYDSRRPYQAYLNDDFVKYNIRIPFDLISHRIPNTHYLTAKKIGKESLLNKMLANIVESNFLEEGCLSYTEERSISSILMDVFCRTMSMSVSPEQTFVDSRQDILISKVKGFIEVNLRKSDLNIDYISNGLNLSKSTLYRLFKNESMSINEYIWHLRVTRCQEEISKPYSAYKTLSEVAFEWGFNSNAHFSRLFKSEVGQTPKEFKHSVLSQGLCPK